MPLASVWGFIRSAGPIVLFAAACAYGVLEVHLSTDTWIGLAAGRQILDTGFSKLDTFSYTAAGRPWYNQNWLTDVWLYWLYSRTGPDAVIWATWLTSASIFGLTLLSSYWRSGTWLGSSVAAAMVALGCRNFLCARPATTGFFCLAGMWAMMCALEGQGQRVRPWPIVLLLPILLVWGGVHGSFTLGYGILLLYLVGWIVLRWLRPASLAVTFPQICGIAGSIIIALSVTLVFGPLGIDNFTHGEKIAGSSTFRLVAEWIPPYRVAEFPPASPFWTILATSTGGLVIAAALRLFGPHTMSPRGVSKRALEPPHVAWVAPRSQMLPHVSLLDVIPVLLGLGMAFWARRFGPIFYILGAPIILTWIVSLAKPLAEPWKGRVALIVALTCWPAALVVAWETSTRASTELYTSYAGDPHDGLLERATQYDKMAGDAIEYLRHNNVRANLFLEWNQAGLAMFYAPDVKVFIDGRAQQVYDEATYWLYGALQTSDASAPAPTLLRMLDGYDTSGRPTGSPRTDAVLLRRGLPFRLTGILLASHEWPVVYASKRSILFMRRESDAFRDVTRLVREGREWRPDTPEATVARGEVLAWMNPPDLPAAIAAFEKAVELDPSLGWDVYPRIAGVYRQLGQPDEGREYFRQQQELLSKQIPSLNETQRQSLLLRLQGLK